MTVQGIKETAGKWGYKIPTKYNAMMLWLEDIRELDYSRDKDYITQLCELKRALEKAERDWLKENQSGLLFLMEPMNIGFASVDVLTIMERGTKKVIERKHFLGAGEAQHFLSSILSQGETIGQCIPA